MYLKLISFLFFLTLALNSKGQESEFLIGKWVFKDVYNKEKIDKEGLQMLKAQVINKLTFEFNENGHFSGYLMGEKTTGTWSKKDKPNRILLLTNEGDNVEFRILELTKDRLALKVGLGEFLMVRVIKK